MVVVRGVNVYPSEVEAVLLAHPGVAPHYLVVVDRRTPSARLVVACEVSGRRKRPRGRRSTPPCSSGWGSGRTWWSSRPAPSPGSRSARPGAGSTGPAASRPCPASTEHGAHTSAIDSFSFLLDADGRERAGGAAGGAGPGPDRALARPPRAARPAPRAVLGHPAGRRAGGEPAAGQLPPPRAGAGRPGRAGRGAAAARLHRAGRPDPARRVPGRPGDRRAGARTRRAPRTGSPPSTCWTPRPGWSGTSPGCRRWPRSRHRGCSPSPWRPRSASPGPADLEAFVLALAEQLAGLVEDFSPPDGGRRYRVVVGGHPAPGTGRAEEQG